MGDAPSAPATPDYGQANREAISTDVSTLPTRNLINQAAQLGTKVSYQDPLDGSWKTADFTGLGQSDLTKQAAASTLDITQQYGPDLVKAETDLVKQADPTRYALNEDYYNQVMKDYDLGSALDPSETREVQQNTRSAQAARGNVLGDAPAFDEVMALGSAGQALKQQRTSNVQSALGLAPVTGQYGAINSATGPTPVAAGAAGQLNPNAGQLGTSFATSVYGDQASIYNTQTSYASANNPWAIGASLVGSAIGAATSKI